MLRSEKVIVSALCSLNQETVDKLIELQSQLNPNADTLYYTLGQIISELKVYLVEDEKRRADNKVKFELDKDWNLKILES